MTTAELTAADRVALTAIAEQVKRIADKLDANERPGHVDYINKHDAAVVLYGIANNLVCRFGKWN